MKLLFAVVLTCCIIFPLGAAGIQNDRDAGLSGVTFEQTTFKEALAKAQKENKLVLLDNYSDT
jgi:hypothetical protein